MRYEISATKIKGANRRKVSRPSVVENRFTIFCEPEASLFIYFLLMICKAFFQAFNGKFNSTSKVSFEPVSLSIKELTLDREIGVKPLSGFNWFVVPPLVTNTTQ